MMVMVMVYCHHFFSWCYDIPPPPSFIHFSSFLSSFSLLSTFTVLIFFIHFHFPVLIPSLLPSSHHPYSPSSLYTPLTLSSPYLTPRTLTHSLHPHIQTLLPQTVSSTNAKTHDYPPMCPRIRDATLPLTIFFQTIRGKVDIRFLLAGKEC